VTPQTQAQTAQVAIESLTKTYGALRAVDSLSFDIHQGEWVALMGPSGSGKTTLINVLGGLDTLSSGRIVVDGVDLAKLTENQLVRYRAEKIGFVFQQFHLVPYLTAVENVMLAQFSQHYRRITGRRSVAPRRPRRSTDAPSRAAFRRRTAARGDRPRAHQSAKTDLGRRANRKSRREK
jgi:predicted ABC-type transport system involved in lysophospholipase L1 biosynthesis ATPase subunit